MILYGLKRSVACAIVSFLFCFGLLGSSLAMAQHASHVDDAGPSNYRIDADPVKALKLRYPVVAGADLKSDASQRAAIPSTQLHAAYSDAQSSDAPTFAFKSGSRFHWAENVPFESLRAAGAQSDTGMALIGRKSLSSGASSEVFHRVVDGVEVFQRHYRVLRNARGDVVAGAGLSSKALPRQNATFTGPAADKNMIEAVRAAISDLTQGRLEPNLLLAKKNGKYQLFDAPAEPALVAPPRAKPVWYEIAGVLIPSYYIELQISDPDSGQFLGFAYVIDADRLEVLLRHNQVQHQQAFSYRGFYDDPVAGRPAQGPHGDVLPKLDDGPDKTTLIPAVLAQIRSWSGLSTGDPWLPDGATETIGNNVVAYADRQPPDGFSDGDVLPVITSAATFDYALDRSQGSDSIGNANAAAVNMFIVNNYLHDWWYDYGFDEAAGNAQDDNYGRGGIGGDRLRAEAQDYSGYNNANMFTPADGMSPRMQQYLWDDKDAQLGVEFGAVVTSHPSIGSLDPVTFASFGPIKYAIEATTVVLFENISDIDSENMNDACQAAADPSALSGKIALIIRGDCNFTVKVKNAQDAGAVAAIVYNNLADGAAAPMGGEDDSVTIPSVGINNADGIAIAALVDSGDAPTVAMFNSFPLKDSSFDNGIIAHEWGHYIQNRLVGDGAGLTSFQSGALGEGWSDFHSMMFLVEDEQRLLPGNADFSVPYATGTYVEPFLDGIRRAPYSTDMSINPLTFAHITNGAEPPGMPPTTNFSPHAAGEIWAAMLWDLYANLLNRYSFVEAQDRMANYLVAGYMMTPIDPTYTEARDALLAVMLATDSNDYDEARAVFARRGMGSAAMSPPRYSEDLAGVVEDYGTGDFAAFSASVSIDTDYSAVGGSYCSNDNVLDVGETARLRIRARNQGNVVLNGLGARVTVLSDHEVLLGNDGVGNFPAVEFFQEVLGEDVLLTLLNAEAGSLLTLQIEFFAAQGDVNVPPPVTLEIVVNYDGVLREPVDGSDSLDMESVTYRVDLEPRVLAASDDKVEVILAAIAQDTVNTALLQSVNADEDLGEATLFLPNNSFPADFVVETVPFMVSDVDPFSIAFWHFYWLELGYDGGVVEVRINDGEWIDVTEAGGVFTTGYSEALNSELPGRMTFTGINGDLDTTAGNRERIDFGLDLAGQQVQLRFRVVSDESVSDHGWHIDNLTLAGIASPVFHDLVAGDSVACDNRPPYFVQTGSTAISASTGQTVTLSAPAMDWDGDAVSYEWTQVSGPAVTFEGGSSSSSLTFNVSESGLVVFSVTISDGENSITRQYSIMVIAVQAVPVLSPLWLGFLALCLMLLAHLSLFRARL